MLAFLGVVLLPLVIWWLLQKPKENKTKRLPPGPFKWPIIGNIFEIAAADPKYPHRALIKLSEKYGSIYSVRMGSHNACVITSYEGYKELATLEYTQSRFIWPFVTDRAFGKPLGIIFANRINLRHFTVKTLREFGFGKKNSMEDMVHQEAMKCVEYLKEKAAKSKDSTIPMSSHDFAGSFISILWSMVAGYTFPVGDTRVHEILEHGNRVSFVTSQGNIYNAFPYLRFWFPKLTQWDKHMESHKSYQDFVQRMIDTIKKDRQERADTSATNFIEVFLDEIEKHKSDPNTDFTEQQLIVILQDLFLAGSETTGTAIIWFLLFLSLNPRVDQKLRQELETHYPGKVHIPLTEFKNLPYLKATMYEVLRCADIATIPPPRCASEDVKYKDYIIPKGYLLMFPTHKLHTSPEHWGDPENFRPERFLDETETNVINNEKVLPFGLGKRNCMGDNLVWAALPAYIANILKNFKIETIPGREPSPLEPIETGTLNPRPFSLKFTWIE